MVKDQNGSTSGVTLAVIALIVAVTALALAWIAYNRTGADLEDQVRQEVNSALDSAGQSAEDAADDIEQGARETEQRIDEGPDGVDEDDTDVPQQ